MAAHRKYSLGDWPAADQAAWLAATSDDVSLLDQGDCVHWSAATRRNAYYAYCGWLAFLREHHAQSLQQSPSERLTEARLNQYLDALTARMSAKTKARRVTGQGVAACIGHLAMAFQAIAPSYDTTWMRQRQYRTARAAKPKDRRRQMIPAIKLFALGIRLMDEAETLSDPSAAAVAFRDGLLIAVLTATTLRRKNLTQLRVDQHVRRTGAHYMILIDAVDTKTAKPIDHPLPEMLTPYLERYLTEYRLRFKAAREHSGLWPSIQGDALCPAAVWAAVSRRTRAAFGHSINLHLVRTLAAIAICRECHGGIAVARDLLGHANVTTTDSHYRPGDSLVASRQNALLIDSLREQQVAAKRRHGQRARSDNVWQTPPKRFLADKSLA
jgi:integrase